MATRLSAAERAEIWERIRAGERPKVIAANMGRSSWAIRTEIGAVPEGRPVVRVRRSRLRLSLAEREEISRGLATGESAAGIAWRLGRAASTVSREIAVNGGRQRYRAQRADLAADDRARRPRPAKLARCPRLRREVVARLRLNWSPQQIARSLREDFPDDPEMRVSHETIYQSLFVQGRGALRKELTAHLRTRRTYRRPGTRKSPIRPGRISGMVLISERPAEVADRAIPGHWEGDLLMGSACQSAIGTLVERSTRYVMLMRLPNGHNAEQVRLALAKRILTLPAQLRRSLTWDQGKEMAQHVQFTVDTGVQIYFCDPHSPWQRGSNENTNGLLRQYFPRNSDLSVHSQRHLDKIAAQLNGRPRQTLGWKKPSQAFAELCAMTG